MKRPILHNCRSGQRKWQVCLNFGVISLVDRQRLTGLANAPDVNARATYSDKQV